MGKDGMGKEGRVSMGKDGMELKSVGTSRELILSVMSLWTVRMFSLIPLTRRLTF